MALAVCALLDAAGERLIRGLWARREAAGIGSPASHAHGRRHPHLSFAVLPELVDRAQCARLGREHRAADRDLALPGQAAGDRRALPWSRARSAHYALGEGHQAVDDMPGYFVISGEFVQGRTRCP